MVNNYIRQHIPGFVESVSGNHSSLRKTLIIFERQHQPNKQKGMEIIALLSTGICIFLAVRGKGHLYTCIAGRSFLN
jgi:hypothetical protein